MERSQPDPDNRQDSVSYGADGGAHANGLPLDDHRWWRSVVENSSEIVTIVDPDGTLLYASPAFGRMLSYKPEEVVGKMNVLDHVHPDDLPHVLEETEKALSEGGVVTNKAEYRFRHKDGSWRWVESVGTYLLEDPYVGVVVSSRDVTDRKEAEERFRTQYKNLPVPTYTWQRVADDFVLVDHNDAAQEFTHGHVKNLAGSKATELLSDRPLLLKMIRRSFEERTIVRQEMAWRMLRDREEKCFVVTCVFVSPDLVTVHIEDITEQMKAEKRLRFQAQLLGAVGEAVIALDMEGRVVYWNRAAQEMYGWSEEEAMGHLLREVVVPEGLKGRAGDIAAQLREGRQWSGEFVVRRRDGTTFLVEGTDTPVFDEDGEQVGVVGVLRDVSERKEAEEALRRSEAEVFSILESITDAFFALDRECRFIYVNRNAGVLFERNREDLIGERLREDPTFYPAYRRAVAEGTTVRFEAYYPPVEKWFSVRAYPSKAGLSVYLQDITERKKAEETLKESEDRLRVLFENTSDVISLINPDNTFRYTSPSVKRVLGYEPEELEGRLVSDLVHPEDFERFGRSIVEQIQSGVSPSIPLEGRYQHKDGSWRFLETTFNVRIADPHVRGVVCVSRDVTERKRDERALRESEQRFKSTFEDAGIGMALSTPDGRYLRVNRAFCELLGYAEDELVGMTFRDIVHPDDLAKDIELGRRLLEGEVRTFSMEKRYLRKDGSPVWVELTVSLLRDTSDEPLYSISQAQDITGRKALEERLMRQAFQDSLTGLPNRHLFVDRLAHALERTRRTKGRKIAVLFMDLDDFKVINDSLGHEVGNRVLEAVAERLKRCLRPEDTLARLGGDEFVVLVEEVEGLAEAVRVAERITEELKEPLSIGHRRLFARASIGIALGNARTRNPLDLLRDADTAMYQAKEDGAAYNVFDPAMYERAVKRLELENDLRRAVEAEEFVVHYQPIVDLQTDEAWGLETLLRWRHPERGLLEPSEFMPVVEESGLVVPVGERVLEEACRQTQRWHQDLHVPAPVVSVNLSAVQLRRSDLACTVAETLRKTGLDPSRLSLDVTESAYIRVLEGRSAALDRLKELGVGISIDDFGTGYSSLSYLKRLPADVLKIDRSFVRGLGEDVEDTAIVRMVIDLAHTLGMKVVAEGVEKWAQAALLSEMGCDLAQGYHFARPLPPEEVPAFLAG